MTSFADIQRWRRTEEILSRMGLKLGSPAWRGEECVALNPLDQCLPVYSRDAEIFVGTLEQVEDFILGVQWARNYDTLLGLSDEQKRGRKEQDQKNKNLVKMLKEPHHEGR